LILVLVFQIFVGAYAPTSYNIASPLVAGGSLDKQGSSSVLFPNLQIVGGVWCCLLLRGHGRNAGTISDVACGSLEQVVRACKCRCVSPRSTVSMASVVRQRRESILCDCKCCCTPANVVVSLLDPPFPWHLLYASEGKASCR
jgi:hypothetical protein